MNSIKILNLKFNLTGLKNIIYDMFIDDTCQKL